MAYTVFIRGLILSPKLPLSNGALCDFPVFILVLKAVQQTFFLFIYRNVNENFDNFIPLSVQIVFMVDDILVAMFPESGAVFRAGG